MVRGLGQRQGKCAARRGACLRPQQRRNRRTAGPLTPRNKRLALVTGSTAGIGYAIAEQLAHQGLQFIIKGRTEDRVAQAIARLAARGADTTCLHGLAADVSTVAGVARTVDSYPVVDVLVNSFGNIQVKTFAATTDADWDKTWNDNVMSGMRLSRHNFPRMLQRKYGRVLFISSESALQIPAEPIHHGALRRFQDRPTGAGARPGRTAVQTDVTVDSVLVGPTRSEGMDRRIDRFAQLHNATTAGVE